MKYHVGFDIDLKRNTSEGLYIVVEGIDGSGKTTQVAKIAEYFRKKGKEVVITAEPRKNVGVVGKLIQEVLMAKTKIPSVAFQYLFSAERAIHYQELILPSLQAGKIVISDRCFWSAVPYGILDQMENQEKEYSYETGNVILAAQSILSMYHQFLVPDKTFYLDISIDTAMRRLKRKDEKIEIYENRGKLEKIILGYKWLTKQFPKEFTVIDGEKGIEEVTQEIITGIRNQEL